MKKINISFFLITLFIISAEALDTRGVWIEHFLVNLDIGNTRTFTVTNHGNGTVTATSWEGNRTFYGTVEENWLGQLIIHSRNGDIKLDRYDISGYWTAPTDDDDSVYRIYHIRKNIIELFDEYGNSYGQSNFLIIDSNNIKTRQGYLERLSSYNGRVNAQNFMDQWNEMNNQY